MNIELPEEFTKTLMEIATKCVEGNTDSCQLKLETEKGTLVADIAFSKKSEV